MTFLDQLREAESLNQSMLCVGLDPEPSRFPAGITRDAQGIHDFCVRIVEATADLAIAFKPQIAYFAAHRAEPQLERLMARMREIAPKVPIILDAKRGDIGSTAEQYAREAFDRYGADAVTLSPFMGFDSVAPYLQYKGKGAFLLCRLVHLARGFRGDGRAFQHQAAGLERGQQAVITQVQAFDMPAGGQHADYHSGILHRIQGAAGGVRAVLGQVLDGCL